MSVPFMDLGRLHRPIKAELEQAIGAVLERGDFILGGAVDEFERSFAEYIGVAHAVGVSSGTAALSIALRSAGIGAGDQVIVPAHTYIASALAVVHVGAEPVFCEVEAATGLIDTEQRGRRPRPADGGDHRRPPLRAGGAARAARQRSPPSTACCWSRTAPRPTAPASAAAVRARSPTSRPSASTRARTSAPSATAAWSAPTIAGLADSARSWRNLGQREKGVHADPGFNERLDTLQAAVLACKLPQLDRGNAARRQAAGWYRERLDAGARAAARAAGRRGRLPPVPGPGPGRRRRARPGPGRAQRGRDRHRHPLLARRPPPAPVRERARRRRLRCPTPRPGPPRSSRCRSSRDHRGRGRGGLRRARASARAGADGRRGRMSEGARCPLCGGRTAGVHEAREMMLGTRERFRYGECSRLRHAGPDRRRPPISRRYYPRRLLLAASARPSARAAAAAAAGCGARPPRVGRRRLATLLGRRLGAALARLDRDRRDRPREPDLRHRLWRRRAALRPRRGRLRAAARRRSDDRALAEPRSGADREGGRRPAQRQLRPGHVQPLLRAPRRPAGAAARRPRAARRRAAR